MRDAVPHRQRGGLAAGGREGHEGLAEGHHSGSPGGLPPGEQEGELALRMV